MHTQVWGVIAQACLAWDFSYHSSLIIHVKDEEEVPLEPGKDNKDEDGKEKAQKDAPVKEKQDDSEKSESEEKSQEKTAEAGSKTDAKVGSVNSVRCIFDLKSKLM